MKQHDAISQEEWDQIDAYISGEMPEQDRNAFHARLQANPLLQEARLLVMGIREAALTRKMDSFHASTSSGMAIVPKRKSSILYWLAAASVMVAAVTILLITGRGNANERLFAEYFEPDPGLATAMSSTEDYSFNRGMIDYKTGDYQSAIEAWRPLAAAKQGNDTLHYFSGMSFLALRQADSAAYHLSISFADTQSSFRADAGWYLALALIYLNKKAEAISLLEQVDHPKKAELLSRIK